MNSWCEETKEIFRSSRPEVFCKKGVLRNFTKVAGKHLCQSLWHRCFPVNFVKFLITSFLQNTSDGCVCQTKLEASVRPTEVLNFKRESLNGDLEGFIAKLLMKIVSFYSTNWKKYWEMLPFYACYRNGTGIKKSVQ